MFVFLVGIATAFGQSKEAGSQVKNQSEARKIEVQELKQKLDSAETPEAKRQVIEEYRTKTQQRMAERKAAESESVRRTPQQVVAELKASAGDNPELQKRASEMEARVAAIESMRQKLDQIEAVKGEEKQKLIDELRQQQQTLRESRRQELEARQEQQRTDLASLSPEMQAVRAKAEARKQEIEDLKAALEQAQPQERVQLIDAFREKQKAAMAERRQEMESKRTQQEQARQP